MIKLSPLQLTKYRINSMKRECLWSGNESVAIKIDLGEKALVLAETHNFDYIYESRIWRHFSPCALENILQYKY